MSATQIKMERETMYKWKKAYEEEAQDHIATSINLQKLIKELEEKLAETINAKNKYHDNFFSEAKRLQLAEFKLAKAVEAIQFARMVLSDAKLTGAVDDMNNYLKEIGKNK